MDAHCQTPHHHNTQARIETQPDTLREALELPVAQLPASHNAIRSFAFKAPASFCERIQPGHSNDPLLRQIWPSPKEEMQTPGFNSDPVGDSAATVTPGLLQKYHGRALLVVTGVCAIHCRYCFRRHFPYREHREDSQPWSSALHQIRRDTSLQEVILSGGDPLTLSNRRLASLLSQLEDIPHVKRLRIHTRLPIVLPARVDTGLLTMFAPSSDRLVLVVHANHTNELDNSVRECLRELRDSGITLLNQTVLLRGVNDSVSALADLSERLFECGALPYYLHQLDPVAGAAHFAVPDAEASKLVGALRRQLPGYLIPRLVREQTGSPFKQPL